MELHHPTVNSVDKVALTVKDSNFTHTSCKKYGHRLVMKTSIHAMPRSLKT